MRSPSMTEPTETVQPAFVPAMQARHEYEQHIRQMAWHLYMALTLNLPGALGWEDLSDGQIDDLLRACDATVSRTDLTLPQEPKSDVFRGPAWLEHLRGRL